MRKAPFASVAEMQRLIVDHPEVLGGGEAENGYFTLQRVGPIPDGIKETPRWSVNHLFLSRDATPTIVATRGVAEGGGGVDFLGGMLHYAANAALWWPQQQLTAAFETAHGGARDSAKTALTRIIGVGRSPEAFWSQVVANLAQGRLRMILAVEHVSPDLARMVEFLGSQMRDAQVSVLEIDQSLGPSGRLLRVTVTGRPANDLVATPRTRTAGPVAVPTEVKAQTSAPEKGAPETSAPQPAAVAPAPAPVPVAAATPPPRAARPKTAPKDAWADALRARCEPDEVAAFDDLMRWMSEQYGTTFIVGAPAQAFCLAVKEEGKDRFPVGLTDDKFAAIHLGALAASHAFESEESREALVWELVAAGFEVGAVDLASDLGIPFKELASPSRRGRFVTVLDGIIETLMLKEARSAFPS